MFDLVNTSSVESTFNSLTNDQERATDWLDEECTEVRIRCLSKGGIGMLYLGINGCVRRQNDARCGRSNAKV